MNKHCNSGKWPTVWVKVYDAILCVLLGVVGVYGIVKAMGWV